MNIQIITIDKIKIKEKLTNGETLTFSNETDIFEFMQSKLNKDLFRLMRNGSLRPTRLLINDIMWLIEKHNLQLEEI
jgi:hypothetical protein